jgi:hypothetical protein
VVRPLQAKYSHVARVHTDGTWVYSRRTLFSFDDKSCSPSCCEYISVVFAEWCQPLWGGALRDQEDFLWQGTAGTSSRAEGNVLRTS